MAHDDLQELIESPTETLQTEYKDWIDLAVDNVARANLARHIAALCNFGGGQIILGFSDDLKSTGANPFDKTEYSRDLVSSITKKYLDPSVQCEVRLVRSSAGIDHPVIVVPAHGAAPVCSKAAGPDTHGKPKGIAKGVYYVRKTGPESAPVESPQDWAPIIRRCALHDRANILAALGAALNPSTPDVSLQAALKMWHEAARPVFESGVRLGKAPGLILSSNEQLSYMIDLDGHQQISPEELKTAVREMNCEIRDRVNTGWSMFYPFTREPIAPFMETDATAGTGDQEFLEARLWDEDEPRRDAEMWRISSDGKATLLRPIRGDYPFSPPDGWQPGKTFSPNLLLQELGEFVRHAQAHAERFPSALRVAFRCEFRGLQGREIAHPGRDWTRGRVAKSDRRIVTGEFTAIALASDWPDVVADLAKPILRTFDPDFRCTPDWVREEAKGWRPIGSQYP